MARLRIAIFIVSVVCLSVLLQGAFALECWVCDGIQGNCGDLQKHCKGLSCVTMTKKSDGSVVKRGCSHSNPLDTLANCGGLNSGNFRKVWNGEAPNEPDVKCEYCVSDLCNGAVSHGQIGLLLLAPVVIASFFSIL